MAQKTVDNTNYAFADLEKTGAFAVNISDPAYVTIGKAVIKQVGSVVSVEMDATGTFTGTHILGTISGVDLSQIGAAGLGIRATRSAGAYTKDGVCYFTVTDDGTVEVEVPQACDLVSINMTYSV